MKAARIGVYVCWCGSNIAKMVDVEKVAKELTTLPNVVIAKDYKYMCSDPGQDLIIKDIKEHDLTRVVVAACSPRMHEPTFRKALANAGLNPYMFEMANVREQDSWVHTDRDEATKKAKELIAGAIKRVAFHEELGSRTVEINPATLVIGGGIAGIAAALEIANAGKKVYLVEKSDKLGGNAANVDLTYPYLNSGQQIIKSKISQVKRNSNIEVFLNSEVKETFGYIGNFECKIEGHDGKATEIKYGNVVVATGLRPFDPSGIQEYGYGKLPNVVTSVEFEKMLLSGKIETKEGKEPKNIAIIHCVGSRNNKQHEYCSRTCCMTAMKYAFQLRSAFPKSNIFEMYADMRAFGKGCEEFYASAANQKILFMMFDQMNNLPKIKQNGSELAIDMFDLLSNEQLEVPADMVILMTGMEAYPNAKETAHAVGISMCGNAFYIEKHPKLDPVATTTDGVYIIGSCQSPKDIPDCIDSARAASARILATISQGSVHVEVTTAEVNEDLCCGCRTCVKVCPYSAVSFNEEKKVSQVNEVLCKGCGTCGGGCPSGAIKSKHFTDLQILTQIEGIMEMALAQ